MDLEATIRENINLLPHDLMSTRDEYGQPQKHERKDTAAFLWLLARLAFPGVRFWLGCARSKAEIFFRRVTSVSTAADGNRASSSNPISWKSSKAWSNLSPAGIQSHRCAGPARVHGGCRSNWLSSDILPAVDWWGLVMGTGYSLQGNRKTVEGKQHPDRNTQFEYINARVTKEMRAAQPVISVDTKKKELIGNYVNRGKQWLKKGEAQKVNGHDFPDPEVPRAHPYGIYELTRNKGFVNVGTDHDTATFAVASIRAWWRAEGRRAYPNARRLLITADAGGNNGARLRLWKWELQRLSDELRLPIAVCHFPPGTSKWNKVEHRLFSFISSNWRGEPLADYETVVNLISKTTTTTGLKKSFCRLDRRRYPIGRKISDKEWATINLLRDDFHGDWNYTYSTAQEIITCDTYLVAVPNGLSAPFHIAFVSDSETSFIGGSVINTGLKNRCLQ